MLYQPHLIELLKSRLQQPLPGEVAQYRMAPSYRPKLTRQDIEPLHPRQSAVLVLMYPRSNELHLVFTKRKVYKGVHSGQMSFPGGKVEPSDTDFTETALREAQEEVGVNPRNLQLLGSLSELYIPPSNFLVYPTVAFCDSDVCFVPQVEEVEEIVEIPVSFFMDAANVKMNAEITLYDGMRIKAPAYVYESHIIWGATAIMLSEFTYLMEEVSIIPKG